MQHGLKPIRKDHRDYDFHRTFFGAAELTLPQQLNVDAGLWTPDQDAMGYPEGCTGFAQSDLCTDEDARIYDPGFIYDATPPGGEGPRDIRASLGVICGADLQAYLAGVVAGSKRVAYFNIRAYGAVDWFDAIRIAIYSTQDEKRSVSIGTPWYPVFESPVDGVLPKPASFSTSGIPWHNWKVSGWKLLDGVPYLIGKSWQGRGYGDNGFHYVSRELTNLLMSVSGTAAFTVTHRPVSAIQTVNLTVVQTIVSFIRSLLGL